MAESECDLRGLGVLVTRPAHQATELCALIDKQGGSSLSFPALQISPPESPHEATSLLRRPADLFIFISPNAVSHAMHLLGEDSLPGAARLAAVGSATAQALLGAGYRVDLQPAERFDSEGLLELPELAHLQGQRVVIVRGEGGRALLGDTLKARGAELVYAEIYRRGIPEIEPGPLLARWQEQVDLVTTTSGEILTNLVAMLGRAGWDLLRRTPLLVISDRMRQHAEQLGFETLLVAENATNKAIVTCLCEWVKSDR